MDRAAAGRYALGAVVAKIAFWAPQFVVTVSFPRLVGAADPRRLLAGSALVIAGFGGLLAGVLAKEGGDRRRAAEERVERHRPALQAYEDACHEWGAAPADVGLAWLLHRPAVTAPIVGPRTMEQFEGSLRALDVRLDEAQLARLDEIFPGYRPAPMEYAW